MLLERRRLQRVAVEAAVEAIRELRTALGAGGSHFLLGGAALRVELLKLRSLCNIRHSKAVQLIGIGRRDGQVGRRNRASEIVTDKDAQGVGGDQLGGARLLQLVAAGCGLQARPHVIDLGDFTALKEQVGDLLELFGSLQAQLCRAPAGGGERQPVIGFVDRLDERAAGDFGAGVRRFKQRGTAAQRGAQAARQVYVAGHADQRLVLADGVGADEAESLCRHRAMRRRVVGER